MPKYDAKSARCRVFTFKEGLLSAVAHDLEIDVSRFTVDLADDGATVTATFDARSLKVLHAMVDGHPSSSTLSDRDKQKIEDNIVSDVLAAKKHGEIVFTSTEVTDDAVRGRLTMAGRTHEVRAQRDGDRVTATLHQPDWGIKPFSAMLGALKIKPDVKVELTLTR
ncbi:MAG: YceI family protein [Myxococcales bacterium]|nr:YceI family protein [Myxococcales bacterium]